MFLFGTHCIHAYFLCRCLFPLPSPIIVIAVIVCVCVFQFSRQYCCYSSSQTLVFKSLLAFHLVHSLNVWFFPYPLLPFCFQSIWNCWSASLRWYIVLFAFECAWLYVCGCLCFAHLACVYQARLAFSYVAIASTVVLSLFRNLQYIWTVISFFSVAVVAAAAALAYCCAGFSYAISLLYPVLRVCFFFHLSTIFFLPAFRSSILFLLLSFHRKILTNNIHYVYPMHTCTMRAIWEKSGMIAAMSNTVWLILSIL